MIVLFPQSRRAWYDWNDGKDRVEYEAIGLDADDKEDEYVLLRRKDGLITRITASSIHLDDAGTKPWWMAYGVRPSAERTGITYHDA